jgi:hypothetical protein
MADDVPGPGRGRSLAGPAFPDDDGSADPELRAHIAAGSPDLLERLGRARLLVAVVAVLDEMDEGGGDKESHMAVVSMVNAAGERGLLAFTGLDALTRWDPQARPVPVTCPLAAQAALDDGATALVIDVSGPVRLVVTGPDLRLLAAADFRPDPAG